MASLMYPFWMKPDIKAPTHKKPAAWPSKSLDWVQTLPSFPGTKGKHNHNFPHKHTLKSSMSKKSNLYVTPNQTVYVHKLHTHISHKTWSS